MEESDAEENQKRKLKKEISDVSLDSKGYPNCFATPQKACSENEEPLKEETALTKGLSNPSFLRRRPGQLTRSSSSQEKPQDLKKDLGFAVKKKPAHQNIRGNKKKLKAKATCLTKAGGECMPIPLTKGSGKKESSLTKGASKGRKPWTKLLVTTTRKEPWRAYILGTHAKDKKGAKLIVETTFAAHPSYQNILAEIKRRLEEEHLTKEEARELRGHLYQTW